MATPSQGTRLSLGGSTGTVKFVGEVQNTSGIWLGVEWDDSKRGKHDGVKDGIRYFTCRIPNSGSFIRPTPSISYGVSFLYALRAKYVEMPHGSGSQEKVMLGSSNGAIEVEAVDLDKIRGKFAHLDRLREVSLDNENVSRYDETTGTIRATCPNVRGLDLSTSLIPNWETIARISAELPALQRLTLNRNRLQAPTDIPLAFSNLLQLRLNGTLITWPEVKQVTSVMPALRVVELGYNLISKLSSGGESSALESINLDSNECNDWVHICDCFQHYPSLERIVLTSNKIDKIPPPVTGRTLDVKHLSLSFNALGSWGDIDALSTWCPNLQTLTLIGNPLFNDPVHTRNSRQLAIARYPSLSALDAATISAKERKDCELFYLSHIALHGPKTDAERTLAHPRYADLCLKYGRPDERDSSQRQEKLSSRLMDLNMYYFPKESLPKPDPRGQIPPNNNLMDNTDRTILRVLPTMTLRAFRLKVRKTMKQHAAASDTAMVLLWLQMQDTSWALLDIDRDQHDLAWLGVESGSNIICTIQ
ncbi:hypothetical protein FB45DRAFT_914126 [Roridomyces roridus]|uniref:CAP-Gly domain-containing protein n=1 Tax=Roridomyces roridus TaxID=1738132 RepID=A0AAD7BX76_9AGAR|nr:hypothetical protein FB45DRAFT_914126 [Roridomyces roridus]